MKTILKSIIVVLTVSFYHSSIYAQTSSGGNSRNNASWFLGWDGSGSVTSGSLEIQNRWSGENIYFSTNDGTGTAQKVAILANGNVGIGTTPATPLHVFGSSANQTSDYATALIENEATSTTPSISIVKVGLDIKSTGNWLSTGGRNIGLNVYVDGADNNYSGIFLGGNVGIGAATPTELLQVLGGNIDVNSLNKGYMINGAPFLWCNNEVTNVLVGIAAGTGGQHNSFLGYSAGNATISDDNTFVGFAAGSGNYTGSNNTFVGSEAGWDNNTASFNTMVGNLAGYDNNADGNTFVGYSSGTNSVSGDENTYVGYMAGTTNSTGQLNAGLGSYAGANNTSGHSNVFVGYQSGANNTSGTDNVFVGHNARPSTGALTNATAIGALAQVNANNSMVLGSINGINGATSSTNVGIGTTAPSASLHVDGTFRYRVNGASPTSGHVLTTDANGNATWQPLATGTVSTCGTTIQNRLSKWCAAANQLDNSIVSDNSTQVGISTPAPNAKLHITNTTDGTGVRVATNFAGIFNSGIITGTRGGAFNIGSMNQTTFPTTFPTTANINGVNALPFNAAVVGFAEGNTFNFGGIFEASSAANCPATNIGVYAAIRPCGTTAWAGYFQGDVFATGAVIPNGSDIKLKDSIQALTNALALIERLNPKHFVFKTDSFPYMNLSTGRHYGLIAQQVDTVVPQIVHNIVQPQIRDTSGTIVQDTMSFLAVDYTSLIPIAIRGIQELDSLKVGTNATAADSNHLVKWNTTDKTLVNSQVYDNGTRVGIPVVNTDAYVNVTNHAQEITANFESDFDESTEVVKASYSTDGNPNSVAAVYGYSKYVNGSSQDDGVGGKFIGGKGGVWGIGDGDNDIQIGVGGESMNSTSMNVGVLGKAVHYTPSINVGFSSYVDSADIMNVGVAAESGYINSSSDNIGVISSAQGSSSQNIGGVFQALDSVGTRYGIFAEAHSLAMGPLAYAGYFDGDVIATGTVSWTSDAQLKQNVNDLQPKTALEAILRLQPKTYQYRTADFPYLGLSRGNQYGLLAQEVEQVLPDLVSEIKHPEIRNIKGQVTSPSYDYKGLNYVGLIPVLISAVKQQQTKIDSLETVITDRLTQLEERINGCCGTGESNKRDGNEGAEISAHQMSIELSTMQVIVLEQNVPNPFAEQTSISYFIPEDIKQAQIIFSDMLGRTIKTADVQTGYGVITVFASSLSTGQYSYSLLVDGKVVETRKMNKGR